MSGLTRLKAKRDRLFALAVKKRSIDVKKQKVKIEEARLRKEIMDLKRETKRDIIMIIKKRVTSPEAKRTFKRGKALFRAIQKGINKIDKKIN